ncbi:MAG: DEAD/DEAH box helicase family protein [Planctomycetota bacterium]
MNGTLFEPETTEPMEHVGGLGGDANIPRPYQVEDIAAAQGAWQAGKRAILYRAATGLGKATTLGTICAVHRTTERVLVIVDSVKLAKQLRQTVGRQIGWLPGLVGGGVFDRLDSRVVVAVAQSLYSKGDDGLTRVERVFDPTDFGMVLIDECESALADEYAGLARHFLNGNPELDMLGCTATPIRGDGVGMGALFDHVVEEEGPLNRGPLWAFQNGWLVPPKQKWVRCSVDFSTLKPRRNDAGEVDFSDKQLAKTLADEKHLIEMAQGVIAAAGDEPCIVICPNSTDICDNIADYLNGQREGCASAVHGNTKTCRNPEDVMAAHRRGKFQFLCGVNMLTKGYDDPRIRSVFILRPTRSQRLFQQIIGRAFRPDFSIARDLGQCDDPAQRRSIIAASDKPHCNVYCLVGVSPDARDMTIADMLMGRLTAEEMSRVKEKMLDGVGDGIDAPERNVGEVVADVKKEIRDEREASARRRAQFEQATADIRDMDDAPGSMPRPAKKKGSYDLLARLGYKDHELDCMGEDEAGRLAQMEMSRIKSNPQMSSKGQRRLLEKRGLSEFEVMAMTKADASRVINHISKSERWGEKERGHRPSPAELRQILENTEAA